jgi:hypothetical protein
MGHQLGSGCTASGKRNMGDVALMTIHPIQLKRERVCSRIICEFETFIHTSTGLTAMSCKLISSSLMTFSETALPMHVHLGTSVALSCGQR